MLVGEHCWFKMHRMPGDIQRPGRDGQRCWETIPLSARWLYFHSKILNPFHQMFNLLDEHCHVCTCTYNCYEKSRILNSSTKLWVTVFSASVMAAFTKCTCFRWVPCGDYIVCTHEHLITIRTCLIVAKLGNEKCGTSNIYERELYIYRIPLILTKESNHTVTKRE